MGFTGTSASPASQRQVKGPAASVVGRPRVPARGPLLFRFRRSPSTVEHDRLLKVGTVYAGDGVLRIAPKVAALAVVPRVASTHPGILSQMDRQMCIVAIGLDGAG